MRWQEGRIVLKTISNYTPLNTSLDKVLMQIKDRDLSKMMKSKYCWFHRDHGHDTDECYDFKQQIEVFLRQGKLKNFVGQKHRE